MSKIRVKVTFRTGNEEIDDRNDPDSRVYEFDTAGEAEAFEYGLDEAMQASEGWLDASADIVRLDD